MNIELIKKLYFSFEENFQSFILPPSIIETLQIIDNYFPHNNNNKLCFVFPSKENVAQWLSIPLIIDLIQSDYDQYKHVIIDEYKQYKMGDPLILNDLAVVKWAGIKKNIIDGKLFEGPTFKTKESNNYSSAEVTLTYSEVTKLHRA